MTLGSFIVFIKSMTKFGQNMGPKYDKHILAKGWAFRLEGNFQCHVNGSLLFYTYSITLSKTFLIMFLMFVAMITLWKG